LFFALALSLFALPPALWALPGQGPLRVAVVGLVHGHAQGILPAIAGDSDVQLVAVVEPSQALQRQYADKFHLDRKLFYTNLETMLNQQHPEAVLVYTSIADHRRVIEAAARHGVASMVEKPLATTMEDALAIRRAAREHHVQVLVNYETTWYPSNAEVLQAVRDGRLGTVRKVVVHDGHEGPKEIGVGPEFLSWLTDPQQDGAGALFDFGCYGADLLTVMMHGQAPLTVTAVAQTDKPQTYPHVDDDATVILRYPGAQGVLMPSWDWTFARKDMEVYGSDGLMVAVDPQQVKVRLKGQAAPTEQTAPPLPPDESGSLRYLAAVLRGQLQPRGDLSGLDTNMLVMQILTAARESAQTGRTVTLQPLPE
jgi:glucose-fructose oxidoreductase